jgi:hypothetical protein
MSSLTKAEDRVLRSSAFFEERLGNRLTFSDWYAFSPTLERLSLSFLFLSLLKQYGG